MRFQKISLANRLSLRKVNSALMTRGYYRMPSDQMFICPERWDKPFYDSTFACSSYENCHVPWGNTHEESLLLIKKNDLSAAICMDWFRLYR